MDDLEDDDLELKAADAGALFRAEMWATNTMLGYWKHLLAVLVVGLLCFLFYGQFQSYTQRVQRGTTSEIADIEADLPVSLDQLGMNIAAGILELEDDELEAIGDRLLAVGQAAGGAARTEALIKAAEVFRVAGISEKRRTALVAAASDADGVLQFAGAAALANLELEIGEGEAAIARLKAMMADDGFLAQQAALDLGLALEQLDRGDEAIAVYDDFLSRWPESPRRDQVQERRARVSG